MEDGKIVDLFLQRNTDVIGLVADKYGARLRKISYKITQDQFVAEECENDAYMEAWNRIPPNEPRTYLFSFLVKIVRSISINRCMEMQRKKRSVTMTEITDEIDECFSGNSDTEEAVDHILLGEKISAFLQRLPKEKRTVFIYRYYYCESVQEIAQRCGYSESKVKMILFRLRNDLKKYLIKEGYVL